MCKKAGHVERTPNKRMVEKRRQRTEERGTHSEKIGDYLSHETS